MNNQEKTITFLLFAVLIYAQYRKMKNKQKLQINTK